jgi:hypothetical protein
MDACAMATKALNARIHHERKSWNNRRGLDVFGHRWMITSAIATDQDKANLVQERTLSSAWTFFTKFLLPPIWILTFGYATFLWSDGPPQMKFVFLVAWIAGTTSILWINVGLKRVRMDERQLYVSNYVQEIHIPFSAITDVKQNRWLNSRPITICFRDVTEFGDQVRFIPKQSFQFWRTDPVVNELKQLAGLN